MQLDESSQIEALATSIARATVPRARVHGQIREGVPRRLLLDCIHRHLGGNPAIVVLSSLLDPDVSVHGLLQAAAHLGHQAVAQALDDRPLRDRARSNGQALAQSGHALVVWVPAWSSSDTTGETDQKNWKLAMEEVLGGWLSVTDLPVIVLAHQSSGATLLKDAAGSATDWVRIPITPPFAALPDDAAWQGYAAAANKLRVALRNQPIQLTAQQIRLLVALIGLGRAPRDLLDGTVKVQDLSRALADQLKLQSRGDIAKGVFRFLLARKPVSREVALDIARVPDEHQALITDCLGEAGDLIDIDDGLRVMLRWVGSIRSPENLSRVHIALADYHQSLDGAAGPIEAWQHIDHWLEKTHNLGLSGPVGAERWERLKLPTREFYWDRARSLSVDHHEYVEAARLFETCLERFGRQDAYSWHYLGFNLDRAGIRRKDGEHAFRKAVELRPDHPWYNGRLVTFLIDQARFRAADEEWCKALERMDPDGENVAFSSMLAKQAHRWVVKAWLSVGEFHRARTVFDDIPNDSFSGELWYRDLREAVEDAEEALRLGESVYPSTTPMSERWLIPREILEHAPAYHKLRSWFPGRVSAIDDDGIHLVLAVPHEDTEKRRLVSRTLMPEDWLRFAGGDIPEEGDFIFLAIYDHATDPQGIVRISMQPTPPKHFQDDDAEMDHALRYVRRTQT